MSRRSPGDGALFWSEAKQRYIARVVIDGRRVTRERRKRSDAARVLREIQLGRVQPRATRERTGVYLRRWLDEQIALGRYRDNTIRTYRSFLPVIDAALGSTALASLTPAQVQTFIASLQPAYQPASIRLIRALLGAALADAERLGLVHESPVRRTRAPVVPRVERDAPSITETAAVIACFPGLPMRGIVLAALVYGLRQSEVAGLRWQDIGTATITIAGQLGRDGAWTPHRKRGGRLTLPLLPLAARTLDAQRAAQAEDRRRAGRLWREQGFVFTTLRGDAISQQAIYRAFAQGVRGTGLPFQTFHDLRHATSSLLDALGVDQATRLAVLGHAALSTNLTYTHSSAERLRAGLERLERALGDP